MSGTHGGSLYLHMQYVASDLQRDRCPMRQLLGKRLQDLSESVRAVERTEDGRWTRSQELEVLESFFHKDQEIELAKDETVHKLKELTRFTEQMKTHVAREAHDETK